ncbi:hypothetical protein HMPREF0290_0006 [Corynebacterium efficiens YS-314]|nr:hypothetical protein HMPREF0290_0006 [Corynebacterium efficiens YS-314]
MSCRNREHRAYHRTTFLNVIWVTSVCNITPNEYFCAVSRTH